MSGLDSVEKQLDEMLVKNAPFQLPENARKWLAAYAWIFSLVGAVLGGIAALLLLPLLGFASILGTAVGAGGYVFFAWLAFLVLVADVVVMAMATPKLQKKQKAGWNLMFYATLFFGVYSLLDIARDFGFGSVAQLLWNMFWLVASLYVLFQVRKYFVAGSTAKATK